MQARPIQKTVGGITFEDRFPHLQEDSPEAVEWQWDRSRNAQEAAEASANYRPVRERLLQLSDASGIYVPRKRGAFWFSFRAEEGDQQLIVSETPDGPGRCIVSNSALAMARGGGKVSLAFFEPSQTGRYVAVGWFADGDMMGSWSVYDTASGRHVLDTPGVIYTSGRPGWLPDETGFWLAGRTAEGLHQIWFTPVAEGTADRPPVVLGQDLVAAKHSGLTLQVAPDGRRGVAVTEPHEHIALVQIDLETLEAAPFLPDGFEGECDGSWIDGEIYVARVSDGAPRGRVVAIPAATSRDARTWRELTPEGEGFIAWAAVIAGRLYVGDLLDVSLRVRVFDLEGRLLETLPLETPGSSPSSLVNERCIRPNDVFVMTHATFDRSPVTLLHDPETQSLRQIDEPKHRLDDCVAEQRFATSRDGARVPYFLVRRRDLDGSRLQPTLVHGYGGFNMSQLAAFPAVFAPFIEAGGVFVLACLRGGGEYGKAWHDGGRLFNKQNTFDDLKAVAEALMADKVSTPDLMAFMGGSNGGLLAGVAIVQQPHLWRVVVPTVPLFDMMEPLPDTPALAGIRAIFFEDYGDPSQPDEAASIFKWSPYHNIRDGVPYPAVYQVFGEKDLGCMPFHGRKFTARLDEAKASADPVHLRVWRDASHGVHDREQSAAWNAEWLAFVMDHIGLTAAPAS